MSDTNKHMQGKMYWLHCLSPLHVGSGEGAEYIDNPIMREKVTKWPFVPGSSVKGVISAQHGADDEEKRAQNPLLKAAFGSGGDDQANAGVLIFADAQLICLPVRSLCGTFAWVTSPLVLLRLKRDYPELLSGFLTGDSQKKYDIYTGCSETLVMKVNGGQTDELRKVFLEDLNLSYQEKGGVSALAEQLAKILWPEDEKCPNNEKWREIFCKRFAIVHDEVFGFLANTATQIDTRVRIKPDQKTVADGALWTEESLPAETILAGVVWQDQHLAKGKDLLSDFCTDEQRLQLGGNATVGRGQIRCIFSKCEQERESCHG